MVWMFARCLEDCFKHCSRLGKIGDHYARQLIGSASSARPHRLGLIGSASSARPHRLGLIGFGLASLFILAGPAKAEWSTTINYAPGSPILSVSGNATSSAQGYDSITPSFGLAQGVKATETCSGSTADTGAFGATQDIVTYQWLGTGPVPQLSLTFNVSASAAVTNPNSGRALCSASTDAANIGAAARTYLVRGGNLPVLASAASASHTFPNAFTQTFSVSASAGGSGSATSTATCLFNQ